MQTERVQTERFQDQTDLMDVLIKMERTSRDILEMPMGLPPVIYILGPDGTQYSTAILRQETLTDGSVVFHIELRA